MNYYKQINEEGKIVAIAETSAEVPEEMIKMTKEEYEKEYRELMRKEE